MVERYRDLEPLSGKIAGAKNIVRLIAYSFRNKALQNERASMVKIIDKFNETSLKPVALPTTINKICVLRGPHADKDSREHFELRTHKFFIDFNFLINSHALVARYLMYKKLSLGVYIKVKYLAIKNCG